MAFRMGCRISILSVMLLLFAISISKTRADPSAVQKEMDRAFAKQQALANAHGMTLRTRPPPPPPPPPSPPPPPRRGRKRKNEDDHENPRAPMGWRPLLLDPADQHYVVESYPAGVMHASDVRNSDINGGAFVEAHFNGPANNGQRSIQLGPNQSVYLVRGTVRILLQNGPVELTIRENSFLSALERAQAQGWPPGVSVSAGAYFRSESTVGATRWTVSIFNANRIL
ncbi:unnamed protein product [Calypogeia fissa]